MLTVIAIPAMRYNNTRTKRVHYEPSNGADMQLPLSPPEVSGMPWTGYPTPCRTRVGTVSSLSVHERARTLDYSFQNLVLAVIAPLSL